LRNHMLANQRKNILAPYAAHGLCDDLAFALDNGNDGSFNQIAAHRSPALSLAASAHVGFVYLNRRPLQLQVIVGKNRANLLEDAPRAFVGDASFPLNLLGRNSAAGRTHEIHRVEPSPQRGTGLLKDGSFERIELVSAVVARESSAIADAMVLAFLFAFRAVSNAVRKAFLCDVAQASIVIRKLIVEVFDAVAEFFGDALFDSHGCLTGTRLP